MKKCENCLDRIENRLYKTLLQDSLRFWLGGKLVQENNAKKTIAEIVEFQEKHGDDRDDR